MGIELQYADGCVMNVCCVIAACVVLPLVAFDGQVYDFGGGIVRLAWESSSCPIGLG
jgi:hypothetical protein